MLSPPSHQESDSRVSVQDIPQYIAQKPEERHQREDENNECKREDKGVYCFHFELYGGDCILGTQRDMQFCIPPKGAWHLLNSVQVPKCSQWWNTLSI